EGRRLRMGDNVEEGPGYFTAVCSASDNGVLAFQESAEAAGQYQATVVDRSGKTVETVGAPADVWATRFSHDNRRLARTLGDPGDIWIHYLARHVETRFTFNPADDSEPVWFPDDSKILFASQRSGGGDLYLKSVAGTGADELLYSSKNVKVPTDVSPDGRLVLFNELNPKTKWDVSILSLSDRKVTPYLQGEFDEVAPMFSPDGRWVAYSSNESGRYEVYVQAFPGPGGKWQVSTTGGVSPVWRRDGKELYYLSVDQKLMSVSVKTGEAFETEAPKVLFPMHVRNDPSRLYDVSADGLGS